ncbi:hypothetical protein E2562_010336 [Oryza meyeriana var. granulata]|uniref:DUF834 domain-containing protein n=1 Tax=Oryza meyeriana var. granulata TaxID=110450 RepID=A0A6G1F6C0_9ORYZ|nr:hypothetical protein E2562_010336 [Oryza meyeriana var. granulata]
MREAPETRRGDGGRGTTLELTGRRMRTTWRWIWMLTGDGREAASDGLPMWAETKTATTHGGTAANWRRRRLDAAAALGIEDDDGGVDGAQGRQPWQWRLAAATGEQLCGDGYDSSDGGARGSRLGLGLGLLGRRLYVWGDLAADSAAAVAERRRRRWPRPGGGGSGGPRERRW